jgi:hypothetical protein
MPREIPLTQGFAALVDDEDYAWLSQWAWFYDDGYAERTINHSKTLKEKVRMHRLIAGATPAQLVDHRNRRGLDNRRSNLRVCTSAQNARNVSKRAGVSSPFIGVSWVKRDQVWSATIRVGSNRFLGYFDREEHAALAHDQAARELHGEFATLNFPELADYSGVVRRTPTPSSSFPGVSWHSRGRKWMAAIKRNGVTRYLGLFSVEEEAAAAYDAAAKEFAQ